MFSIKIIYVKPASRHFQMCELLLHCFELLKYTQKFRENSLCDFKQDVCTYRNMSKWTYRYFNVAVLNKNKHFTITGEMKLVLSLVRF